MQDNPVDELFEEIATYAHQCSEIEESVLRTAYWALLDSLGCALLGSLDKSCSALLGPYIPDTQVPKGVRVPGTRFKLDPIKAAFDIATCVRWFDFNDTWLAVEWGHPSDNLGAILATADYCGQRAPGITLKHVLHALIKAYEIQGILSLEHSFNKRGWDHVFLVRVASIAAIAPFVGLSKEQTMAALSHAWIDGPNLRVYRHAPNTGTRKSWAAADATSRAVQLAWLVKQGEMGYNTALSAVQWGFFDAFWDGLPINLPRPLGTYVMPNILFKVAYPAEFHGQTAVECALELHPWVKEHYNDIKKIVLYSQAPALKIIHKVGSLHNFADRDHCLEYMVAVALLKGNLEAIDYSDESAKDERIHSLRAKMVVMEDTSFTEAYYDAERRAIANSIQIFLNNGQSLPLVTRWYPLGHRTRRTEAEPLLKAKFYKNVQNCFSGVQQETLCHLWDGGFENLSMPLSDFMGHWVKDH